MNLLYTVHDKAVHHYRGVVCLSSERDALDQFTVLVNDPTTAFHKHPHDFTLMQVGVFNNDTGEISPITPKIIANASSLKKELN